MVENLKIIDILEKIVNFDEWISVWDMSDNNKPTKLMKVGNIPYKKINEWMYNKEVYAIHPLVDAKGRKYLIIKIHKIKK